MVYTPIGQLHVKVEAKGGSGDFEKSQWKQNVDKLHQIMNSIHEACLEYGREGEYINYMKGANIAGFMKVAHSMVEQGII